MSDTATQTPSHWRRSFNLTATHALPCVGAAPPDVCAGSRRRRRHRETSRSSVRADGYCSVAFPASVTDSGIGTGSMAAAAGSGVARAAGRSVRSVGGRRSAQLPLDRSRVARGRAGGADRLRDARRDVHARGNLAGGDGAAAGAGATGITVVEVMPVSEFPAGSDGDTTASFRTRRRGSTARRRLPCLRRSRACARPRRDPRRRLQPSRSGRMRVRRVRRRLLHAGGTRTSGATR